MPVIANLTSHATMCQTVYVDDFNGTWKKVIRVCFRHRVFFESSRPLFLHILSAHVHNVSVMPKHGKEAIPSHFLLCSFINESTKVLLNTHHSMHINMLLYKPFLKQRSMHVKVHARIIVHGHTKMADFFKNYHSNFFIIADITGRDV